MPEVARPKDLLDKVAGQLRRPAAFSEGATGSILSISGAQYGSLPADEDVTRPTGFDPQAAALFEAVVESAYLVASADGVFDDTERAAFEHVVLSACNGSVTQAQLRALLADLADLREEDGPDRRAKMVARTVTRPEQAREVLRVAALIALVSEGVSDVERGILERLASEFRLAAGAVEAALEEARHALAE
ncbi:MAG TPA: tellurite resistance TerB family protein [Polyangiaceae bacterium]|jgi:tellurite resistance protein|nr:tellurite resistance TerB family protein [Polyangiaceae bacterium]